MRTARLLTVSRSARGVCPSVPPDPRMQTPSLDADPPGHVTCDTCWEAKLPSPFLTDARENITFR